MKRLTFVAAAIAAGFLASELSAQQTSTGAFGQRTTGGTSGVSAPRSNSGNTASSQGSSFGNNGTTSTESPSGLTMMRNTDDIGQASADARYIRGNRTAGDFVGVDVGDARTAGVMDIGTAGGGRGGQQFTSLFSSSSGRGGNNVLGQLLGGQFNQGGGNQRTRSSSGGNTQLRIPIRMDFTITPAATTRFTAQFQKRLGKLPGLTMVSPIEVVADGDTVVLRGAVASEGDRQLAEDLAKLEPEVSKVRNELTVQSLAESDAGAPPAPTNGIP